MTCGHTVALVSHLVHLIPSPLSPHHAPDRNLTNPWATLALNVSLHAVISCHGHGAAPATMILRTRNIAGTPAVAKAPEAVYPAL